MTIGLAPAARASALATLACLLAAGAPAAAVPSDARDHVFRPAPSAPSAPDLPPLAIPRASTPGSAFLGVDPSPALPDPRKPAQAAAIPRLVGRAGGKDVLAFPLA